MKILQIHKYFSKNNGGGSVTAFFETKNLLEEKGHKVIVFSMQDSDNEKTPYDKYFIKHFDINKVEGFLQKIKLAFKSIYNFEAQKKLEELIRDEKPEVAHVHNIYHYITPAIFKTLKKNKIPIVYKLSDYKPLCPNYKLFNKGKICEKCKGAKYYNCFLNKCLKDSFAISFIAMLEAYVHNFLGSYKKVDLFLAPSEFIKKKCVEFGITKDKIKILRNVVDEVNFVDSKFEEGNYFLYYGRISEEKGIEDLIKAVKKIKDLGILNGNSLKIVGKGPQEKKIKELIVKLKLKNEVEMVGYKKGVELKKIIKKAKFVVLPSIWYDNSPLIISEAGLFQKPVIVSDSGGSKEMINEETGVVFKTGNVDDLAKKIVFVINLTRKEREVMGSKGQKNIKKINNKENYYKKLLKIYKELIEK